MKHQGQANKAARAQLQGRLSVDVEDVEKRRLYKADFALEVPLTYDQRRALDDAAQSRKEPAGRVLARVVDTPDPETGRDIEVLTGWDTLSAHIDNGVLGILPPNIAKTAGGPAIRGLQGAISF